MPDKDGERPDLLKEQLREEWSREMGLPLRLLMLALVLATYCCSMLAIGVHKLTEWLRRMCRGFF